MLNTETGKAPGGHVPLTKRKPLLENLQSRPSKEGGPRAKMLALGPKVV